MEKFRKYFKERESGEILESAHGFIAYLQQADGSFYIKHLFVAEEGRSLGEAQSLADQVVEIARAAGASVVYGSVAFSSPSATRSLYLLIQWGMTLAGYQPGTELIILKKEI